MRRIKIVSLLLALVLAISLLAGCGGGELATDEESSVNSSEQKATGGVVSFWNGFTSSDGEILTEIVNRYNKDNDKGITIKMDIIPWANFHEKLPTAIATHTAPQLVLCGNDMLATYNKENAFISMEDFFEATGTSKDDFNPASLDLFTINGKLLGIPMQINGYYLYWNKDRFKEIGLDPETPPKTWDELEEIAIKLTNSTKNIYGFGVPSDGFMIPEHVIMCNGGMVIDDKAMKSTLNSPVTINSLKFLQNLTYKHKVSPPSTTGADMDNLMFAGQLGMYINGPWLNNGLKEHKVNYGVTTIPAGTVGQKGTLAGCSFNITAGTSEEDKACAYDFIAYWNTTTICKEWSLRNGFPPYLKSVADDQEVKNDSIVSELYKALDYVQPVDRGITVMSRINNDILTPLAERILYNGEDPAELVPAASDQIDQLLASQ
jgi:multiple sugar transport system substrate-binding protein